MALALGVKPVFLFAPKGRGEKASNTTTVSNCAEALYDELSSSWRTREPEATREGGER